MRKYSVQPRNIFERGSGSLPFAKNMPKNIGKKLNESLNKKYSQKPLDHNKKFA